MLGYVTSEGRGRADRLIRDAALRLRAEGLALAGAVQVNLETDPARKCDMDLHILSGPDVVRISQDLGALSRGCRLDPEGLERAVGLVAAALAAGADLLVVNKFGKQELDGRGFRPVIAEALMAGVPVLTAVSPGNVAGFERYAEGMATHLPDDVDAICAWCRAQAAEACAARA
ncbi:DUF2478 domain-containing protein [Pseudoponticoccus marisrubri]|uniref:3-dehydroquinate dehydratase n=1 Tax=Pseudoponticoccus marisrubri TaxID=1685382 RepID=A0A0W7WJX7_9RHOB|nr:DUF2478 domain-containing protein [Pseudoponticoccus marisrubri]KUF10924.1 3-dehydroquinate dehydratase [Pseudoponticoccus marisrubri]